MSFAVYGLSITTAILRVLRLHKSSRDSTAPPHPHSVKASDTSRLTRSRRPSLRNHGSTAGGRTHHKLVSWSQPLLQKPTPIESSVGPTPHSSAHSILSFPLTPTIVNVLTSCIRLPLLTSIPNCIVLIKASMKSRAALVGWLYGRWMHSIRCGNRTKQRSEFGLIRNGVFSRPNTTQTKQKANRGVWSRILFSSELVFRTSHQHRHTID
ncbi:hypothetical protein GOBAR_AA06136 [Gossypium barbadense]|uniref:Uncharacterized protein n=1 Tax=Gossypium barbadense TaxID=3634 RepID=A0A2P5YFR3_GOSBA|nr:hypothetical protein GOBAR_AA06136 [Gossypium barbadense]